MAFLSARIVATLAKQLPKHANKVPNRCVITSYIGPRKISTTQYGGGAVPIAIGVRFFSSSSNETELLLERVTKLESEVTKLESQVTRLEKSHRLLYQMCAGNYANDVQYTLLKQVFSTRSTLPAKYLGEILKTPLSIKITTEKEINLEEMVNKLAANNIDKEKK